MKNLKKSMLTEETIRALDGVKLHWAQLAFPTSEQFVCERFEKLRSKEEWKEDEVEFLKLFLGHVAYFYQPSAPKEVRDTQGSADRALQGILNANSDEKSEKKEWQVCGSKYVRLSEKSLHYLRQVYPDIYLKRHQDSKFQQVAEAIPHIQSSEDVIAWFVARIVNVAGGHKKLRQALEADLKTAGLRLVESKKSYGVVSAEISEEEEAKINGEADEFIKKGGQL